MKMDKDIEERFNAFKNDKEARKRLMLHDSELIMNVHDFLAHYQRLNNIPYICMATACKIILDGLVDELAKGELDQLPLPHIPESKNWRYKDCATHVVDSINMMAEILMLLRSLGHDKKGLDDIPVEKLYELAKRLDKLTD